MLNSETLPLIWAEMAVYIAFVKHKNSDVH